MYNSILEVLEHTTLIYLASVFKYSYVSFIPVSQPSPGLSCHLFAHLTVNHLHIKLLYSPHLLVELKGRTYCGLIWVTTQMQLRLIGDTVHTYSRSVIAYALSKENAAR